MTVPTYDQLIDPLLRVLVAQKKGITAAAAHELVAAAVGLSAEERALRLPSGAQLVYKNRIGWAHDRLKRAGLSSSPERGVWKLTDVGMSYAATHPKLTPGDIAALWSDDAAPRPKVGGKMGPSEAHGGGASPEERIEAALLELRSSVGRDLLENIGASDPSFFERLVLDLLHAMGYGADRSALQRVGGSGDGGIDGIISLDRLGLEKVYVQAKRWKNNVGSPEIQTFMGALQLQGAGKGVFITTSAFTKDARDAATKARGTIVLVDGDQLTALMIEHRVAVSHKMLFLPKVDSDYFDDA